MLDIEGYDIDPRVKWTENHNLVAWNFVSSNASRVPTNRYNNNMLVRYIVFN